VRAFFEGSIAQSGLRETHLRSERDTAAAAAETLRARLAELEGLRVEERREKDERIAKLEAFSAEVVIVPLYTARVLLHTAPSLTHSPTHSLTHSPTHTQGGGPE